MKILVISDIHGNALALEKVLNQQMYDMLLIVGDSLYHGPRNPLVNGYNPQKVADLLNAVDKPILAVRGNCDAEVDQMLLNFPTMQDYTISQLNNQTITMSHGHLFDPIQHAVETKCDIYITGHTHLPILNKDNGFIYLNPGSISLPKEGNPPTYALIKNDTITIYTLDNQPFKTLTL